jgi:hypothetical protein
MAAFLGLQTRYYSLLQSQYQHSIMCKLTSTID